MHTGVQLLRSPLMVGEQHPLPTDSSANSSGASPPPP